MSAACPMFPLGTVLLPGMVLPLHVFEDRYRTMVRACLAGDRRFGVVLIERGSEVGGGDVRTDVGTMGAIREVRQLPDGRFALAVGGEERVRVAAWLPDDPYPQAHVEAWPDTQAPGADPAGAERRLRSVLGLAAEAGLAAAPTTVAVSADPVQASYQMAALAPLGPLDRQRLLGTELAVDRLVLLEELLAEQEELLRMRLAPP